MALENLDAARVTTNDFMAARRREIMLAQHELMKQIAAGGTVDIAAAQAAAAASEADLQTEFETFKTDIETAKEELATAKAGTVGTGLDFETQEAKDTAVEEKQEAVVAAVGALFSARQAAAVADNAAFDTLVDDKLAADPAPLVVSVTSTEETGG